MTERWLKICHDGIMKFVDLPCSRDDEYPRTPFLDAVYREINCDSIEIVHARGFNAFFAECDCVLIIDECGKLKDGCEDRVNGLCSLMYAPGIDCIVGDALLGFRSGPEVVPCPESLYHEFVKSVQRIFSDYHLVR